MLSLLLRAYAGLISLSTPWLFTPRRLFRFRLRLIITPDTFAADYAISPF
jgi:hypothetical protein